MDYHKQLTDENVPHNGRSRVGMIVNVSSVGAKRYLFSAVYGIGESNRHSSAFVFIVIVVAFRFYSYC